MIPKRSADEVTGTLSGTAYEMKLDPGAARHLMGVLIGQYSDPELASVREISTNARDAHIAAGVERPIEVSTPNDLHPFLTIRDFGTGLSEDDIDKIYSSFGASTKRDSNAFNGCLGIGCKAPLAYAQQFTLTGVKGGIRTEVAISKNAEGGGTMTVVSTDPTSEPNGVTVTIPCRRYNDVKRKALNLFSYWPEGSVLVDGVQPPRFEGRQLTNDLWIVRTTQSTVVMGGVPYPAKIDHGLQYGYSLVAYVEMGDVEFAPSRESLVVTHEDTIQTLQLIHDEAHEAYSGYVQKQIDACETAIEALTASFDLKGMLPKSALEGSFSWRGIDLPRKLRFPGTKHKSEDGTEYTTYPKFTVLRGNPSKLSAHEKTDSFHAEHFQNVIVFEGYDRMSFTAGQRKKLDQWAEDNDSWFGSKYILLTDAPIPDEFRKWIPAERFHDWADVAAIKLARVTTSSGRLPGSYDLWKFEGGEYSWRGGVPADEIDADEPIYYCDKDGQYDLREIVAQNEPDATLVVINATRVPKFLRTFEDAKHARDIVQQAFDAWKAKISKGHLTILKVQGSGDSETFRQMDADRVDDPQVKRAIRLSKIDLTWLTEGRSMFDRFFYYEARNATSTDDIEWDNPLVNYPLIGDRYDRRRNVRDHPDHIYAYMNLIHSTTNKEA